MKEIVAYIMWSKKTEPPQRVEVQAWDFGRGVLLHRPPFLLDESEKARFVYNKPHAKHPERYGFREVAMRYDYDSETFVLREQPTHRAVGPAPNHWCLTHRRSGLLFLRVEGSFAAASRLARLVAERFDLDSFDEHQIPPEFTEFCTSLKTFRGLKINPLHRNRYEYEKIIVGGPE